MSITSFRGDYWFLSNFYPAKFTTPKGAVCHSVEHAFQACKTLDANEQQRVLKASTPAEAKRLGRRVKLRPDWNKVRLGVMYSLVMMKFQQNPDLANALENTGDTPLVEGNSWGDTFWGVCKGRGENNLGKILMMVRTELRNEAIDFEDTLIPQEVFDAQDLERARITDDELR